MLLGSVFIDSNSHQTNMLKHNNKLNYLDISITQFYPRQVLLKCRSNKKLAFSQKYTASVLSIMYCACYVPYCFKSTTEDPINLGNLHWRVKKNILQKILCVAVHLVILVKICSSIVNRFSDEGTVNDQKKNSMLNMGSLFNGVYIATYFVLSIRQFEPRFKSLLDFQYSERRPKVFKNSFNLENIQNMASVICPLFSISLTFLSAVFELYNIQFYANTWTILCFTISQLSDILISLAMEFPDTFFIFVVLSFRDRAHFLRSLLVSSTEQNIPACIILNEYKSLERYTDELNKHFGMWILVCTLGPLPFYSSSLMYLFRGEMSMKQGLSNLTYFCSTAFFLSSAANISSQVNLIN